MRKTKFIIIVLLGCMVAPQTADAQILGTILGVTKGLLESSKNSKKAKKNEATQNLNAESAPSTQNSNTKSAPSNPNDEVTLVVSSDGKTKDEAVKTALRSAIEQAYGTFVSANTTILNDELVKDEIVTISNGNIRNYEEIACNISQDGKTYVTLKATVSISKLVSYAQSKGATTEFAGSTFGMNMRMKDLNKKNEEIALRNLAEQVIALYPSAFSYKLSVAEPQKIAKDQYGYYSFSRFFKDYWTPSFEDIADFGLTGSDDDYYISGFEVSIEPNEQMDAIVNLIFNTVNSLALSINELKEYETHNIPYFSSKIFAGRYGNAFISEKRNSKYKELRNKFIKYNNIEREKIFDILRWAYNGTNVNFDSDKYKELFEELETFKIGGRVFKFRSDYRIPFVDMNVAIAKILHSFEIIDNMGNSSRISEWENKYGKTFFPTSGTNLLSPWVNYSFKKRITSIEEQTEYEIGTDIELFYTGKDIELELYKREEEALTLFRACFFIPKNEIQKYSSFTIRAVPVNNTVFKYSEDCINELYKSEY